MDDSIMEAGFIGILRHRFAVDGEGVTTLAAFHGCPLNCRYCLNAQCKQAEGVVQRLTPQQLVEEIRKDELYFFATGGGICFGGGEPLLQSTFIKAFHHLLPHKWPITVETSLAVPLPRLLEVIPFVSQFIVDIKDMDAAVYEQYTGQSPTLRDACLTALLPMQERVLLRLPLIPGYNTPKHQQQSKEALQKMGFTRFDLFTYKTSPSQTPNQVHTI